MKTIRDAEVIGLTQEDIDFLKARADQDEVIRAAGGIPGWVVSVELSVEQIEKMCKGRSAYTTLHGS